MPQAANGLRPLPDPEFDLKPLIRDVIETSETADPRELAVEVARAIPEDRVRDALAIILPDAVRTEQRRLRRKLGKKQSDHGSMRWQETGKLIRRGDVFRLGVAVGYGEWKQFGQCSREEVLRLAEKLDQQAKFTARKASGYRAVAELMEREGASTVSDLPREAVNQAFADG